MYTIESAKWGDIEPLWLQWRTYDLENPEPTIKLDEPTKIVLMNPLDTLKKQDLKTLVLKNDEEILGCLLVVDFTQVGRNIKVCGIQNVAVPHNLRNNGIGRWLMYAADLYIKENKYDLSILYSSLYATKRDFYEKFGYDRHEKVFEFDGRQKQAHLKYYKHVGLPMNELDELILAIGKF